MTSPYDPILTSVGVLDHGKLTPEGRTKYVTEVLALLALGNHDGKGGSPSTKIFNSLVPLPPVAGPEIFNVTTLSSEKLFWFDPDPLAALMSSVLVDENASPMWNAIFPDLLYGKTASALDINGSTPLFPLFDVSIPFPDIKIFPIALPDLALQLNLELPKLMLKLIDLNIKLSLPSIPLPPIPPSLPKIDLPIPPLVLFDLMIGLIKLPFDLLLKLVLPPDLSIVLKLISLDFKFVLDLALDIVIKLLIDLNLMLIVPKLFIASLLIYLKDIVAMVITDVVGLLVGAGGTLTKLVAGATGLI